MVCYKFRVKVVDFFGRFLKVMDLDLGWNIIFDFVFFLDIVRGGSCSVFVLVMLLVFIVDGFLVLKYRVIFFFFWGGKEGWLMMVFSMFFDFLMFMICLFVFLLDSSFFVFFRWWIFGCWFLMMVLICGCRFLREVLL